MWNSTKRLYVCVIVIIYSNSRSLLILSSCSSIKKCRCALFMSYLFTIRKRIDIQGTAQL